MNLMRPGSHRLNRKDPPLLRAFWLRRALGMQPSAATCGEPETESHFPTECGDPKPADQT